MKPLGKKCARTGQPLTPGAVCHSVLLESEDGYIRQDFSAEGWQGMPEDAVGYWRCMVPASDEPIERPLDTEALFDFFCDLQEDTNTAQDMFRYTAALSLLQKRRLILEDSLEDEEHGPILTLVGSQGEGPFEIRDQQLDEAEITRLQRELATAVARQEAEAVAEETEQKLLSDDEAISETLSLMMTDDPLPD